MLMVDPEKFEKKFGHSPFLISTEPTDTPLKYKHKCEGEDGFLFLPRWAPNLLEDGEDAPFLWKILDDKSLALEFCPRCGVVLTDDELEK